MKFPVLGMVFAVMLGQYAVLEFSSGLAQGFAGKSNPQHEIKIATATTDKPSGVFCRQSPNVIWQCPQG